jgi:hypothetical protein
MSIRCNIPNSIASALPFRRAQARQGTAGLSTAKRQHGVFGVCAFGPLIDPCEGMMKQLDYSERHEAFLAAVDDFVFRRGDAKSIRKACRLALDSNDILPGEHFRDLKTAGFYLHEQTYGEAAKALLQHLRAA